MEETALSKRPREEETHAEEESNLKKQKPYNHILSLLDADEEESTQQDLSPLISTLQEEITSSASDAETLSFSPTLILNPTLENGQENSNSSATAASSSPATLEDYSQSNGDFKGDVDDDKERVMRHLLEASDDELGIPNTSDNIGLLDFGENGVDGENGFSSLCDGLWEFEDETANYYTLLQSELFL